MAEGGKIEETHNISLREYFETRIKSVCDHFEARIDHLDMHWKELEEQKEIARKLALVELERRLADLNHAHQRAAEVLLTYITREAWDKYREDDSNWKRQQEVIRASLVTDAEFTTYKETTQQALTLAVGKSQGIGSVWGAVVIGFSIMAAIGTAITAIVTVFYRH